MAPLLQNVLKPTPQASERDQAIGVAVATGRGRLLAFRQVSLAVFAAVILVVGLTGSPSTRYGLIFATVYAIAILGNSALSATLGEINLGAGAFIALGAYTAIAVVERGHGVFLAIVAAIVVSAVVGFVFAVPTSRLTGLAAALVTFALAYSVNDLAAYLEPLTGGDVGKFMPLDLGVGGLVFNGSQPGMLILAVVAMTLAGLVHLRLLHSRPGRIAILVGEAPFASSVFGTRIRLVQLGVWVWASALGGLAGALYSMAVGYVSATQWPILMSILIFVGGLIGGTRSATGAWMGGLVVAGLPLWLQEIVPAEGTTVFFGVIIVLTLLAGGKGLAQLGERAGFWVYRRVRRTR